jgi:hypothetical protein
MSNHHENLGPSLTVGENEFPHLDWSRPLDVFAYCQIQQRFVLQQSFPSLFISCVLWLFYFVNRKVHYLQEFDTIVLSAAFFVTVVSFGALWYWAAYREQMVYLIDDFRIFSIRGVFLKFVNSTPFTPYSIIKMEQSFLDWLFDTWRIQLYCDFVGDKRTHLLPGLNFADAAKFYRMFSREVDRQISVPIAALEAESER